MKSFAAQFSSLITPKQQHAFAKLVPNRLRRLNPHHPRIHHTDSPNTVVDKALTVQRTAPASRKQKARRKRTRKTHIVKSAILVMLSTTLALVLSHSRLWGSTNASAPAKINSTKHVVSPTTSSTPKPPPVVAPKPLGSLQHKSQETQIADVLIGRMNKHLPTALEGLNRTGKKSGHWAWWAFPTNLKGNSEPLPRTCVYASTAKYILDNAPYVWRQILEKVCQLVEKKGIDVLPCIDHGRVKFFAKYWLDCSSTPHWLRKICVFLKGKYK